MSELVTKNNIIDILGYEIVSDEIKEKLTIDPNTKKKVETWLNKYVGKGQLSAVKKCKVKYMEYDSYDPEDEDLDEFEHKAYMSDLRNNFKECPSHQSCPLFCNNTLAKGEDCILELIDTQHLTSGLYNELNIESDDFNDQIIIGQLVSMNIVYNRAMRGLASSPLIEEVKSFTKGGLNIDTKINVNFDIAERTLSMMEKLRKSLVLNRDDKLKVKQIKKANDELSARKRVEEKIKNIDDNISIDEDFINSISDAELVENKEAFADIEV